MIARSPWRNSRERTSRANDSNRRTDGGAPSRRPVGRFTICARPSSSVSAISRIAISDNLTTPHHRSTRRLQPSSDVFANVFQIVFTTIRVGTRNLWLRRVATRLVSNDRNTITPSQILDPGLHNNV